MNLIEARSLATPLGEVRYQVRHGALVQLGFAGQLDSVARPDGAEQPADDVGTALAAYFTGDLEALARISVSTRGTPFCERVWSELRSLLPGETIGYAELARRIGRPTAVRAVARANAVNPIALAIPCHRVIGSDGALRGYAYGLERKAWLLAHESRARHRVPGLQPVFSVRSAPLLRS